MMRCHICGKMLDTQDLEQYFNEVLQAHYYTANVPRGTTYVKQATCTGHTRILIGKEENEEESTLTDCKTCDGYGGVPTQRGYGTDQCPDCNDKRWLEIK